MTMETTGQRVSCILDSFTGNSLLPDGAYRSLVTSLSDGPGNDDPLVDRRVTRLLLAIFQYLHEAEDPATIGGLLQPISREVPFHGVTLFRVEENGTDVRIAHRNGPVIDLVDRFDFQGGLGFSSWSVHNPHPVLLTDIHGNPDHSKNHVRSFLSVPLPHGNRVAGVLHLSHVVPDAFDESDLEVLREVGPFLGAVLDRLAKLAEIRMDPAQDPLTGLIDTAGFRRLTRDAFSALRGRKKAMSVSVVKICGLAALRADVNDAIAERALSEVGRVLRDGLRPGQVAARIEADIFAILQPDANADTAVNDARNHAKDIRAVPIDRGPALHSAWGLASFRRQDPNGDAIIDRARHALDVAKDTGHTWISTG